MLVLPGGALQQPHGESGVSERRAGAVHLYPRGGVQLQLHQLRPREETGQHRSLNVGHDPKDAHHHAQALLKPFMMFYLKVNHIKCSKVQSKNV